MGLDVVLYRLVRGSGRRPSPVAAQMVADPDDLLLDLVKRGRGGGRTPTLDRIDPLGELVVGAERASDLLAELDRLAEVARTPAETAQLGRVVTLVRRCAHERDLEIRFEGD
ncbi:hypothetical protein [Micromonospora halophytica]|uniref:Uncharacterized protein n=1 Tax=Micromonospora halophytica TaxID=47864 RepID=A0A1C5IHP8_9ACTN|nr:hypothetical protein [Micromonospora halophytica]SCG57890.1 hypothetical protein GA0070560_111150 [Micromonospora halophytica]